MDKVALITGAARGIGLATTKTLLAQGWRVAMVDRDADELHAVAGELEKVQALVADVSDPEAVAAMVAAPFTGGASLVPKRRSLLAEAVPARINSS